MTPTTEELPRARAYFGSDFCQALLPAPSALRRAVRAAGACEGFTLVTPPVDDAGLERVAALLAALEGPAEIVANDWGVLRLVARERGRLTPVLGRLMTRILRDPRLPAPGPPEPAAADLATSPGAYGRLLRSLGVVHVEVDSGRPGIPVDFARLGVRPSVELGWTCVARGRVCLYAGLSHPDPAKFTSATRCQRECRRFLATIRDEGGARAASLVSIGNSVFERHDRALAEQALACAERSGGRVVVRDAAFDELGWATSDLGLARSWLSRGGAA